MISCSKLKLGNTIPFFNISFLSVKIGRLRSERHCKPTSNTHHWHLHDRQCREPLFTLYADDDGRNDPRHRPSRTCHRSSTEVPASDTCLPPETDPPTTLSSLIRYASPSHQWQRRKMLQLLSTACTADHGLNHCRQRKFTQNHSDHARFLFAPRWTFDKVGHLTQVFSYLINLLLLNRPTGLNLSRLYFQ